MAIGDKQKKEEKKPEFILPEEIEKRSFAIIEEELRERGAVLKKEEASVIKRVIHTSADFDYVHTMTFSGGAVEEMKRLLREGADIVTDTNMALAGINKKELARWGGRAYCFMAEERIAGLAAKRHTTRAAVSMEEAAKNKNPIIFAIGNAPTALLKLYEMIEQREYLPAFLIGVPVGFVNVEEAKELILGTGIPCIVNRGRKGGSNIAAAVCNAVLYELRKE